VGDREEERQGERAYRRKKASSREGARVREKKRRRERVYVYVHAYV